MAARYPRDSSDGQYAGSSSGLDSGSGLSTPASLDQVTDALELGRGQQELWEEIYKLGVSGVDKYIELPQIVVVGDQSSGKSSVLEAITGVPFPRNSGMCTKFPTQINLRKAAQQSFSVSLDPDLDRTDADRARLAMFPNTIRGETDLGVIVKRAEQTIWPHGGSANSASKDTLKLDFSGPKKDYLTLVDLPGIIHANAGNGLGNEEVVAIRELAIHYMENPRSIILAVVSAANDLNLQLVTTLARTVDPSGSRTLGVITKPDRIDSAENEDMFIKLAKNEIVKFELGWHVLRNRSNDKAEKHCSSKERDLTEKRFFETSRWSILDQSNVGINALKTKMSKLLLHRFAEVIPHVVFQIEQRLDGCKKNLGELGEGYGTVSQMRAKMQEWCKVSKDYISNAAEGYYRDHYRTSFFDSDANDARRRKLRARINAENIRFEEDLRTIGHTVEIADVHPPYPNRRKSRADRVNVPIKMTKADFIENRVEPVIRESAGQELLGDSNPLLVYKIFKTQSQNWDTLAARHMNTIYGICDEFLREVLDFVWPGTLQDRIWSALVEEQLEERHDGANGEVQRLRKDRSRYAKSYDQEYTNGMKRWERQFLEASANPESGTLQPLTSAEGYLARVLAYYEVTSKVFMSNVIVQVVERHLVDVLEDIFDLSRIHEMDDEQIKKIFEEDEHIRNSRAKLQAEQAALEGGLKSARRLAARKDLKLYDRTEPVDSEFDPPKVTNTNPSTPPSTGGVGQRVPPPQPPPRPNGQPQSPLDRRSAQTQPREGVTQPEPVESRPYPTPIERNTSNSARSTNPYQQQANGHSRDAHSPQAIPNSEYRRRHPSPESFYVSREAPPPVPPYVQQTGQNVPGSYSTAAPEPHTPNPPDRRSSERRFVLSSNDRRH